MMQDEFLIHCIVEGTTLGHVLNGIFAVLCRCVRWKALCFFSLMPVGAWIAIVMMLVDVDVQLWLGVEELLPG